jgi:hypothetical protein
MPSCLATRPRPGRWLAVGALLGSLFAATLLADSTLGPLHHTELEEWDAAVEPVLDVADVFDTAGITDTALGSPLSFDLVGAEPGLTGSSVGLAQGVAHDAFEVSAFVYRGTGVAAGLALYTEAASQDGMPSSQAPAGGTATATAWPAQRLPDTREPFNFPEFVSLSGPPAVARWNGPAWGGAPACQ